jgi:hypothetical protein
MPSSLVRRMVMGEGLFCEDARIIKIMVYLIVTSR